MFAADFQSMKDDWPQTIVFDGASYGAVVHDVDRGNDSLQDAGFMADFSLQVDIEVSDFSTLPTVGDTVTYSGDDYRVVRFKDSACGVVRSLFMEDMTA